MVTAPLTPHGDSPDDPRQNGQKSPAGGGGNRHPAGGSESTDDGPHTGQGPSTRTDLWQAAVIAVAVALTGVLLGLLWLWLAPRVPLISDGKAVLFADSEGEEAVGADGMFVLLALGFGVLTAAAVFLFRRSGGVPLVVALAVGGLLGSVLAWRLGVWLGPSEDVVARARVVGAGTVFDAPLRLAAKGALLAWPLAAMTVHLGLTALFGPRDPHPAHPEVRWGPAAGRPGTDRR
jgi:hypothetical protein